MKNKQHQHQNKGGNKGNKEFDGKPKPRPIMKMNDFQVDDLLCQAFIRIRFGLKVLFLYERNFSDALMCQISNWTGRGKMQAVLAWTGKKENWTREKFNHPAFISLHDASNRYCSAVSALFEYSQDVFQLNAFEDPEQLTGRVVITLNEFVKPWQLDDHIRDLEYLYDAMIRGQFISIGVKKPNEANNLLNIFFRVSSSNWVVGQKWLDVLHSFVNEGKLDNSGHSFSINHFIYPVFLDDSYDLGEIPVLEILFSEIPEFFEISKVLNESKLVISIHLKQSINPKSWKAILEKVYRSCEQTVVTFPQDDSRESNATISELVYIMQVTLILMKSRGFDVKHQDNHFLVNISADNEMNDEYDEDLLIAADMPLDVIIILQEVFSDTKLFDLNLQSNPLKICLSQKFISSNIEVDSALMHLNDCLFNQQKLYQCSWGKKMDHSGLLIKAMKLSYMNWNFSNYFYNLISSLSNDKGSDNAIILGIEMGSLEWFLTHAVFTNFPKLFNVVEKQDGVEKDHVQMKIELSNMAKKHILSNALDSSRVLYLRLQSQYAIRYFAYLLSLIKAVNQDLYLDCKMQISELKDNLYEKSETMNDSKYLLKLREDWHVVDAISKCAIPTFFEITKQKFDENNAVLEIKCNPDLPASFWIDFTNTLTEVLEMDFDIMLPDISSKTRLLIMGVSTLFPDYYLKAGLSNDTMDCGPVILYSSSFEEFQENQDRIHAVFGPFANFVEFISNEDSGEQFIVLKEQIMTSECFHFLKEEYNRKGPLHDSFFQIQVKSVGKTKKNHRQEKKHFNNHEESQKSDRGQSQNKKQQNFSPRKKHGNRNQNTEFKKVNFRPNPKKVVE
jgi:hypothetical protein